MKVLTVDFILIAHSMRDLCRQNNDYYLDKNTGKLITLSRNLVHSLAQESDEERRPLPEWDSRMIPLAREIVLIGSPNYIRVPEAFGCPEHKWMVDFSKEVAAFKLKQKLFLAMRGRGSCKRFKEILKSHPEESRQWNDYCARRWQEKIQAWLEEIGILAINGNPAKQSSKTAS
jgi:hypothetical protein